MKIRARSLEPKAQDHTDENKKEHKVEGGVFFPFKVERKKPKAKL